MAGQYVKLPASSSTPIGTQDVNLTQVGGAAISEGQKAMAASLPVVIASDQSTLPVSAASLPLPSGAATAALQTTGNASLSSIDTKLTSPLTVTGPLTDTQLRATPVPVSAAQSGTWNINNISGTVSLPSGASTAAKQPALGTAGSASADVITVQGIASMTPLLVNGSGSTQPISGTVAAAQSGTWNITNVSGTVSLPTGAATEATLSTLNGKVTAVNTGAVTISSALPTGTNTIGGVTTSTPTAGTVTQAAVTVGTSAVRLTVAGTAPSSTRKLLVAIPDPASTATFYIGSSSVTNSGGTRGIPLTASQSFTANNDAGDYYIIASTAAQTVFIVEQG